MLLAGHLKFFIFVMEDIKHTIHPEHIMRTTNPED